MSNPYKDVKRRFNEYLEGYFKSVEQSQGPENLVVLIMIWTCEGYRAAMQGHTKDAVDYLKEARNWLDRFIERAPLCEKQTPAPFVFTDNLEPDKGE